ncbi:hypothetical protein E2C01_071968 [Portunus trituberculatus]|uniref:Uncharacterized protein n=1 Tax=Portunus trituberculatus TaxID=210409 RepID=A0A5B7HWR1_PORTR|nr:hypothetical protein [Portunus trituberculatus]
MSIDVPQVLRDERLSTFPSRRVIDEYTRLKLDLQKPATDVYSKVPGYVGLELRQTRSYVSPL